MFKKIVDRKELRPQQDFDDDGDEKGKKLLLSLKHTYLFFFFLLAGVKECKTRHVHKSVTFEDKSKYKNQD